MKTTAIILNWNELHVSKDSVRILLKEPEVSRVIVVDNGSTDGSREYFRQFDHEKFQFIDLGENKGASIARNHAIDMTETPYIFLLDGDILYVRGTIAEYERILDMYTDAFCVGQNSMELLARLGHNGVYDIAEADFTMSLDYTITEGFPMIWCQYGLFRGDWLREVKFPQHPPFDGPGYGAEDDWVFQDIEQRGWRSLAVDKPVYYHHAHSGIRELQKAGQGDRMAERIAAFEKQWGRNKLWSQRVKRGVEFKELPKPLPHL